MKTLSVLLMALMIVACQPEDAPAQSSSMMQDTLDIVTEAGGKHTFHVEIAVSPGQLERGLMNRIKLDEDAGMLFWFGREQERRFWMKNTLIPLDMIFIKDNGTIHHIHENAQPNDLTSIASQGPVAAVLEINGGQAKALGIKPGDHVKQRFFSN